MAGSQRILVLLLFLAFSVPSVLADSKWQQLQQLQQPRFTLVFAAELSIEARRVAGLLNVYLDEHQSQLPKSIPLKPITIVLQNKAHASNGFVGLLPYRSHWYNKPASFARLEWFNALAVHEGRHIVQFNQLMDHPAGRILNIAFGELGTGAFSFLLVPNWYFEGDAVRAETQMTAGGRGRVAAFDLWQRTALLTQPIEDYDSAMLGTGFDAYPYKSPYVFGYHFTNYFADNYGELFFDGVLANIAKVSSPTLNAAIKKETGHSLAQHYERWATDYAEQGKVALAAQKLSAATIVAPPPKQHWRSLYPVGLRNNKLIAVSVDVFKGSYLVAVSSDKTEKLAPLPKSVSHGYISGSKIKNVFLFDDDICWLVTKPHITRINEQTSSVQCWNEQTGITAHLTQTKITSVSGQFGELVAHSFDEARQSYLQRFNRQGDLMSQFTLPYNSLVTDITPSQGGGWVFVMQGQEQHGIFHINATLTDITLLKPAVNETLRHPQLVNNWLVYVSDVSGTDQLMATSRNSFETYQISSRPFGSYYPVINNDQLVYADYTPTGQQLLQHPFADEFLPGADWRPLSIVESISKPTQTMPANLTPITEHATPSEAAITAYNWKGKLINPHSWFALYDGQQLTATVMSTDVLEKLSLTGNVGIVTESGKLLGSLSAAYRTEPGLVVGMAARYQPSLAQGDQAQIGVTALLPMNLQHQRFNIQVNPVLGLDYVKIPEVINGQALVSGQVAFSVVRDRPIQAIRSPFALHQNVSNRWMPVQSVASWLSESQLTLSGFKPTHAAQLKLSWQYSQDTLLSQWQPTIVFPEFAPTGHSLRSAVSYRINTGAVGEAFGPAVYWRSTEWGLTWQQQMLAGSSTSALGLSVSPNVNLLRNDRLSFGSELSVHYRLQDEQLVVGIAIMAGY